MDEFLSNYYNTNGAAEESYTNDELEKTAQLVLLTKQAEEEGIDLSNLSEEELEQLAEEVSQAQSEEDMEKEGSAEEYQEALEKEAQAKFEEADFLGRVMAHSMWNEFDAIQKEAGKASELAGKGWESVKGLVEKVRGATTSPIGKAVEKRYMKGLEKAYKKQPPGISRKAFTDKMEARARRLGAAAEIGTAAAVPTALAGGGYVGYRGAKSIAEGKEKKQAWSAFNEVVERAALELLEANGYPVEWK